MRALVVSFAWAWLLLLQLAGASHVVHDHENLEAEAATAKVPPSIVNPQLRTGYHFHPAKNWINGNVKLLTNQPANFLKVIYVEHASPEIREASNRLVQGFDLSLVALTIVMTEITRVKKNA